jgi:hypothetical protein
VEVLVERGRRGAGFAGDVEDGELAVGAPGQQPPGRGEQPPAGATAAVARCPPIGGPHLGGIGVGNHAATVLPARERLDSDLMVRQNRI